MWFKGYIPLSILRDSASLVMVASEWGSTLPQLLLCPRGRWAWEKQGGILQTRPNWVPSGTPGHGHTPVSKAPLLSTEGRGAWSPFPLLDAKWWRMWTLTHCHSQETIPKSQCRCTSSDRNDSKREDGRRKTLSTVLWEWVPESSPCIRCRGQVHGQGCMHTMQKHKDKPAVRAQMFQFLSTARYAQTH